MYHIFSIICEKVLSDAETGMVSFIETIDGLAIQKELPIRLPPFTLFSKFARKKENNYKPTSGTIRISLSRPSDGKKKVLHDFDVTFEEDASRISLKVEMNGIEMDEFGEWVFFVTWKKSGGRNWKKGGQIPFNLSQEYEKKNVND